MLNVASVNGTRARLGGHYYSTAKAALIHLTRCAAVELGEKGIRVNSISPGPIATGAFGKSAGFEPHEAEKTVESAKAAIAAAVLPRHQPLPYVGTVEDITQAALYLASDASRLVSGLDLIVDGDQRRLAGGRGARGPRALFRGIARPPGLSLSAA